MRALLIAVSFLIFAGVGACAQENKVAAIEAVDDVVGKLDKAFEAQDAEAVKALMTADHVAVTPYYGTPRSVDDVIASLPDLKYQQTDLSEPQVVLLGPNAAMRTLTAKAEGSFKGKSFSDKVFITSIVVKQNGKWLEKFYQVTRLAS
ncbi:MAG: nuclear transport factor 2 family protein [Alphaproteobacteria bacterium]